MEPRYIACPGETVLEDLGIRVVCRESDELTHGPDALRYLTGMLPMPALPEAAPRPLSDWDRAVFGKGRKKGEKIRII
jgi:hypothetical protein